MVVKANSSMLNVDRYSISEDWFVFLTRMRRGNFPLHVKIGGLDNLASIVNAGGSPLSSSSLAARLGVLLKENFLAEGVFTVGVRIESANLLLLRANASSFLGFAGRGDSIGMNRMSCILMYISEKNVCSSTSDVPLVYSLGKTLALSR